MQNQHLGAQNVLTGVVSLLQMLEFASRDYLEISYSIGQIIAALKGDGAVEALSGDRSRIQEAFKNLSFSCRQLRLTVTEEQVSNMMNELGEFRDGRFTVKQSLTEAGLTSRMGYHVETIYSTLRAELGSMKIRVIPKEKSIYCDPQWLIDSLLYQKYPDMVDEFQRAGRTFAFGENTACIFHLMRVTDFCLRKTAESIGITYDARNWQGIGNAITKNMEQKYQLKTDEWKKAEPFYAEILTDIQAISRGHRNPALHELEKKYDERDAQYMLTVIENFATRVAARL